MWPFLLNVTPCLVVHFLVTRAIMLSSIQQKNFFSTNIFWVPSYVCGIILVANRTDNAPASVVLTIW